MRRHISKITIFITIFLAGIISPLLSGDLNVNAIHRCSLMGYYVDGEYLSEANGYKNSAGTAVLTFEEGDGNRNDYYNNDTDTLTLTNYNGGGIYFVCNASGNGSRYKQIKLVGDNYITARDSFGISIEDVKIIGDGKLTITAKVPISSGQEEEVVDPNTPRGQQLAAIMEGLPVTTIVFDGSATTQTQNTVVSDNNNHEETTEQEAPANSTDSDIRLLDITFLGGLGVVGILICILIIVVIKTNKKTTSHQEISEPKIQS